MKPEDKKYNRNPIFKKIRIKGFIILTLALTAISVRSQYFFWKGLFPKEKEIPVIASSVFEVIRLASLYAFLRTSTKRKRAFGVVSYTMTALFCSVTAFTGWHSEIIETYTRQEELKARTYQATIHQIKATYAERMIQKIAKIDKDLFWVDSKLAADSSSKYWANLRKRLYNSKSDLNHEMDAFLSETVIEPEKWIEKNTARLNLKLEPIEIEKTQYSAIETAIRNTWHMSTMEAQRWVALCLVIATELGIILLATMVEISRTSDDGVAQNSPLVAALEEQFLKDDLRRFFSHYGKKIVTSGVLPRSSVLNAKYRPLRKILASRGLNKKELQDLCNYYLYNHQ